MLNIYEPRQFISRGANLAPNQAPQTLNTTALDRLVTEEISIDNRRVSDIRETFDTLKGFQNDLLGIDYGTAYGKRLSEEVLEEYGIGEDLFKFTPEQLQNPNFQHDVEGKILSAMRDPRMKDVVLEGVAAKKAREDIRQLARKDQGLADVAREEFNQIVSDPNSTKTILDFTIGDYEKLDVSELLKQEIGELIQQNENVEIRRNPSAPAGFEIFDKVQGTSISFDEVSSAILEDLSDDPRVINNINAITNRGLPEGDRVIGDEEAIMQYLSDAGRQIFDVYGRERVIDSKVQRIPDKLLSGGRDRKTQTPVSSNSQVNNIVESIREQGLDVLDATGLATLENNLTKGNSIRLDKDSDGNDVLLIQGTDPEDVPIQVSLKPYDQPQSVKTSEFVAPSEQDTVERLLTNPFIKDNYEVGSDKFNYAAEFLSKPEVQDGFYREYYIPEVLDRGVRQIEKEGLNDGRYNQNQLRYIVHHQGVRGAKHFLETGDILPDTKRKAGDRDVLSELTNALAPFEQEGEFEDIKDQVESFGGNYDAVTTMAGSSALGRHQVLFDTHFTQIKEFIDESGGLTFGQGTPEERVARGNAERLDSIVQSIDQIQPEQELFYGDNLDIAVRANSFNGDVTSYQVRVYEEDFPRQNANFALRTSEEQPEWKTVSKKELEELIRGVYPSLTNPENIIVPDTEATGTKKTFNIFE